MTKILDDFLGWGRPAKTLTRAELEDELAEHCLLYTSDAADE